MKTQEDKALIEAAKAGQIDVVISLLNAEEHVQKAGDWGA